MDCSKDKSVSLSSNYVFNLANRIIVLVIPLITTPYLTRVLGPNELGVYNYANTVATYYLMFSMMGMSILGNKKISLARSDGEDISEIFSKLLFVQVFNSIVSIVLYLGYFFIFCNSNKTIVLLQLFILISAIFDVSWFYQGLERFKSIAIRNILINCLTTILIFLFVNKPEDIVIYSAIKCISVLISQLVLFFSCIKKIVWVKPNVKWIKTTYIELLVFFIPIAAESIFHNFDRVMLGVMINYSAVTFYYLSRMITDIPQCFITSINTIMYPRITILVGQNRNDEAKKLTYYSFALINAVCVGMAFGIAVIAKDFVALYLGVDYQYCAICIPWLAPYIVLAAWNGTVRYQYLIPNGLEKIYSKAIVIGIVLNFILNLILIKKLGVIGAILATVFSEFIIAIIQTKPVWKEMMISNQIKDIGAFLVAGIIMYILVYLIREQFPINLFVRVILEICVGAFLYLSLAIIGVIFIDKSIRAKLKYEIKRFRGDIK